MRSISRRGTFFRSDPRLLQYRRMDPFGAARFGMIDVVMQAARLTPAHRGSHDQFRDLCQVAQLDRVGVEQVVPVVAVDLVLDHLDAPKRALESPVAAHDADVVPHQAANLVPALRDHHALLAADRAPGIPLGKLGRRAASRRDDFARRGKPAPAHHGGLEQRVRREPVGAVQPGHRDLAGCVQARNRAASVEIGLHAAAHIVRRGHHRDWSFGQVISKAQASLEDSREPPPDEIGVAMAQIEIHEVQPATLHLGIDRSRNHVARRQLGVRMVALHERGAVGQFQNRALAAKRLRDEKGLGGGMIQAGGMELIELEVCDRRARPIRHRDTVARRDVGVGGVEIDLAGAACRQHRGARNHFADFVSVAVERIDAPACARLSRGGSLDQQIDRDMIFQSADVGPRGSGLGQRTHYFAAGQVLRMKHAAMAMPTLLTQVVLEFAVVGSAGLNPGEASAEPD